MNKTENNCTTVPYEERGSWQRITDDMQRVLERAKVEGYLIGYEYGKEEGYNEGFADGAMGFYEGDGIKTECVVRSITDLLNDVPGKNYRKCGSCGHTCQSGMRFCPQCGSRFNPEISLQADRPEYGKG